VSLRAGDTAKYGFSLPSCGVSRLYVVTFHTFSLLVTPLAFWVYGPTITLPTSKGHQLTWLGMPPLVWPIYLAVGEASRN